MERDSAQFTKQRSGSTRICHFYALLVHQRDADEFRNWLKNEWAPDTYSKDRLSKPSEPYQVFVGEYPWHDSAKAATDYWQSQNSSPVNIANASTELTWEANYDASTEGYQITAPSPILATIADLEWQPNQYRYIDQEYGLTLYDPSLNQEALCLNR